MHKILENINYIDLFAGIGGFHQAMSSFGANCVFASEWDEYAAKIYHQNYGLFPEGDITKIDERDIPQHDVLCAGFPCQAFSISGKQKGFEDTRGNLFFDIVRIAKHHQPKILILENVRNFEKHDNGRTLKIVVSSLEDIGYDVNYKVLNASDYGLPQNRERIYFVCFKKDLKIKNFEFPGKTQRVVSLLEFLEKNPADAKVIDRPDTYFTKQYEPNLNLLGELDLPNKPVQIGYVNKGGQGERIYSPYGHAITLSAYGGGVGAKTGLYLIDGKIRKLSPRECARILGFPDNFKISSTITQAYKQFGNSVAINVLKAIIKKIIKTDCFSQKKQIVKVCSSINFKDQLRVINT